MCRTDIQQPYFRVGHRLCLLVDFRVERGGHGESGPGLGGRDVLQGDIVGVERDALPVLAHLAEEAMLDGIPFGSSGRIVADGDAQSVHVAEFLLQVALPELAAGAIGSAGVGQDEEFARADLVFATIAAPPVLDGIDGKGCRLSGGPEHDHSRVAANVVNAVWQRHPIGIGGEIVIFDLAGVAPPGSAAIFEVADELAFLTIDTNDRQICGLELSTLGRDDHKLPITAGTVAVLALEAGFNILPIRLEREIHLMEQPPDGVGAYLNAVFGQCRGDRPSRLSRPARAVHGVAGHFIAEDLLDLCPDRGVFFPPLCGHRLPCVPVWGQCPRPTAQFGLWRPYADQPQAMRPLAHRPLYRP